ncbi:MAG TPA: hypothetical protein GX526_04020 [Thermoanaerobacterales bacterium]|nr:hypothetical protein [Thermoanaerobacterales bacterium]
MINETSTKLKASNSTFTTSCFISPPTMAVFIKSLINLDLLPWPDLINTAMVGGEIKQEVVKVELDAFNLVEDIFNMGG